MKIYKFSSRSVIQENHISTLSVSFEKQFERTSMNSRIEEAKFEPETTFEKTINEIKADYLKSITSLDMNLSAIISNRPSSSSEHLNTNLMPWMILKSPETSPQFTNRMFSLSLEGTIQLQILKWWVAIGSSFCLSLLWSYFFRYLSTNSTRCPTEKHSKRQFTFSKQQ